MSTLAVVDEPVELCVTRLRYAQIQCLGDLVLPAQAKLAPGGHLAARFDRIFLRRTGFVTLDRLLKRLMQQAESLMVLDRPETPLHTDGSENDIRCYVTRRKVSAGTRSDDGRDYRDAFLGLAKTWDELGVALWDYLGSRFKAAGHILVQPLDHYVRGRFRPA